MLNAMLDFIFPKTSIISGESLAGNNSNQYISDEEINKLMTVTQTDISDFRNKVIADDAFSLFAFYEDDDFTKIIYELKYGGMKKLGIFAGELLGEKLKEYLSESDQSYDMVIPVPLYRTKIRERGYNQSDMLCRGIENVTGIRFENEILKRCRHTSTQTKLSREERISNLRDAFEIRTGRENIIEGMNIILVDDVVTTGSTLNESISILKENNCGNLLACTLAMAR